MRTLVLTLMPFLFAAAALASDGVFEINRACVDTGCFPGDSPGLPVEITQQGSYRLTGNLLSPNGVTAISIGSDAVTIDLGGFTIGPCTNVSTVCPILAVAPGISGPDADEVTIRNGIVEDFRGAGILLGSEARIQHVTVRSVQGTGIQAGPGSLIQGCIATRGGAGGFFIGAGSTVEGSTARSNDGSGFLIGVASVVRGNSASDNGSEGFDVLGGGGTVVQNSAENNGGAGFSIGAGTTVVQNSSDANGGAGFRLSATRFGRSGGLARSNTAVANQSFGFDNGNVGGVLIVRTWGLANNVANDNNDGGDQIQGGVEMGFNVCNGSLDCP